MKTFNSTLAIAAIVLTSVFGFTSCDKNDDSFNHPVQPMQPIVNETPALVPQTTVDAYLYAPATTEQFKYLDVIYTLSVDGQTKVVKLSEMNEMKDKQHLADTEYMLENYKVTPGTKSEAKIYELHLGNVKNVSITSIKYTIFTDKLDHDIDAFIGASIKSGSDELFSKKIDYFHTITDVTLFSEVYSD